VAQVVAVVAIGLLGFAGGWLTMAAARWRR